MAWYVCSTILNVRSYLILDLAEFDVRDMAIGIGVADWTWMMGGWLLVACDFLHGGADVI
jgi:hypothetical protein